MSAQYQVLARKYRSKNFHELVGQTHVSKALINAIDYNRLHHAYLFTGTRGIGKTTIARILSKCLNCETGITSTPCGVCNTCVAIDEGRFIDLIEIDAASRTKVEDTRELIDNVPYAPTQGRFKVYLIDEVHMLSTHSFNALLKTLEEPPAHVKFLLATTDPQKLPITIISRCLQFVLRPLPQQAISDHLAYILNNEGIAYTDAALWQLANAAKGSMRDALSLTDQAIAFGQGRLTDDTVNDMLGLIDSADLISLLTAIYDGDTQAVSGHIEQMRMQLVDAGSMFDGLAELLHQLAVTQLLPNIELNVNTEQASQINRLASQISADVLQLYYQIIIQGREQIKLANTPLQALEMCLLRLLAFRPLAVNEVPVSAIADASIDHDTADHSASAKSQLQVSEVSSDTDNHDYIVDEPNVSDNPSRIAETEDRSSYKNLSDNKSSSFDYQDDVIANEATITENNVQHTVAEPDVPQSITDDLNLDTQTIAVTIQEYPSQDNPSLTASQDSSNGQNDSDELHNNDKQDNITPQQNKQLNHADLDNSIYTDSDFDSAYSERLAAEEEYFNANLDMIPSPEPIEPISTDSNNLLSQDATPSFDSDELGDSKYPTKISEETKSDSVAESEPVVNQTTKNSENSVTVTDPTDPRHVLQIPPLELTGEWTPEKWDYWLQSARKAGKLGQDELALARQGVMRGTIKGRSTFNIAFDTKNMKNIFRQLANHLEEQFAAEVEIETDPSLQDENRELLPQTRQSLREKQAKDKAQALLLQSPVMQRLNNVVETGEKTETYQSTVLPCKITSIKLLSN